MSKTHGIIATYGDGKLVTDSYGNVLLFKTKEDAWNEVPADGKFHRVVTALVKRKPKPKTT